MASQWVCSFYGFELTEVSRPDLNLPVLVLCLRDCGDLVLEGCVQAPKVADITAASAHPWHEGLRI